MADLRLISFLLIFFTGITVSHADHRRSKTRTYIEASCCYTPYPKLCVRCLTSYAHIANVTILTPQDATQYALLFSLYRAHSTRTYLLKVAKELKAIKANQFLAVNDCLAQIDLSGDQLYMSIKELHEFVINPANHVPPHHSVHDHQDSDMIYWHISNVETWIGSALTDASNCVDEFQGRRMSKLKATVKVKVLNVAEVTSNALALFHRFASRYTANLKVNP